MLRSLKRIVQVIFVLLQMGRELYFGEELDRPKIFRQALEKLSGTFLKFGQVMALRPDYLPRAYCYELFRLLDRVPPFSYDIVREIIETDLGKPPEEKFACFEVEPLASASFGQVHLATIEGGQRVAVKVQRPRILQLVMTDLLILKVLSLILDAIGLSGSQKLQPSVDEFTRWTLEELDYTIEKRHNELLYQGALLNPKEKIPKPYWDYVGPRVLTNEYIEGEPLSRIMEALYRDDQQGLRRYEEMGIDLSKVSENLWDNFGEQVYLRGVFHADPHPANILILEGNIIAYVDFGIVGQIDLRLRSQLRRLVQASATGDFEEAAEIFLEIAPPTPGTNIRQCMKEYIESLRSWTEVVADEHASFRERSLAALLRSNIELSRKHKLQTSPEALTYFRTVLAIDSITLQIAPTFDSNARARVFFEKLIRHKQEEFQKSLQSPETFYKLFSDYGELVFRLPQMLLKFLEQPQGRFQGLLNREQLWERERARNVRTKVMTIGLLALSLCVGLNAVGDRMVVSGTSLYNLWIAASVGVIVWLLIALRRLP